MSVYVKSFLRRSGGKSVTVKPHFRKGSLSMTHVKARNRSGPSLRPVTVQMSRNTMSHVTMIPHAKDYKGMAIHELAREIERDWAGQGKGVNYGAKPYLGAMHSMASHHQNYGADSGRSVLAYFLSNARSWKGPKAKAIKAELNRRLKS